jgi:hypothetical protein
MRKVVKTINQVKNPIGIISKVATTVADGIQGIAQDNKTCFINNNLKELREIYNYELDEVFI